MIYIIIGLLLSCFLITLLLRKPLHLSIVILSSTLLSLILLTLSFAPEVQNITDLLLTDSVYPLDLLGITVTGSILFSLILLLIAFSEITHLINSSKHSVSSDAQRLLLLYCIFGGAFIFSNNILVLSISLFALMLIFFFSKTIKSDNYNFSYLLFNVLGGTLFLVAISLLNTGQLLESFNLLNLFDSYFYSNDYSNLKDFRLDKTFLITLFFFIPLIFTNSLFPLSHCFFKKLDEYSPANLFIFALPNIIFLSFIIKFKSFNPLLLELLQIYIVTNIVVHSFHTLLSRSMKKLIFHTYQLLTSFIAIGLIHYSNQSYNASIFLVSISTILFTCIVFTLSQFEMKNIPEHLDELSAKRLSTPKASLTLTLLTITYTLPVGPSFLGVLTILQESSQTNEVYFYFLPLVFLLPALMTLYLLYNFFYSNKSILSTKDISFVDLSPILPLMIIICLILFKFNSTLSNTPFSGS